jgi:CRISPR-associated protein Cas1
MNSLHLSGYGVKIRARSLRRDSYIQIVDGQANLAGQSTVYEFRPRRMPYDSIFVDGHSGYISLLALHWLSRSRIPIFILNFDGSVVSSILPPMPVKADLRAAQLRASEDPDKKQNIAYELVKAKIQRSNDVLKWLADRYDVEKDARRVAFESSRLSKAKTVNDIRMVEGRVAQYYWQALQSIFPETFCFQSRIIRSHQYNASDPVNLCLNYAYGVLEGECRKAINTVGLEPAFGFLHEPSAHQTTQSLVYDLQEPFRWICDVVTIRAFESRTVDMNDFYFLGDDYRYHIELEAKRRFLELLKNRFNAGVKYKGKIWKWDTIILNKTQELARFLLGKVNCLDFTQPSTSLKEDDGLHLRSRILSLSTKEAHELHISRSTLSDLRKRARSHSPFRTHQSTSNMIMR